MSDPNKRRYRKCYQREFDLARKTLQDRTGLLQWSPNDYEAFVWVEEGVRILFYPHRTYASYSIRVRDQGSKNPALAIELLRKLNEAAGAEGALFRQKKQEWIDRERRS